MFQERNLVLIHFSTGHRLGPRLTRKIPSRTLRVDIALHSVFVSNCFMSHSVQFTVQECKQTKKITSPGTNHVPGITAGLSGWRGGYDAAKKTVN